MKNLISGEGCFKTAIRIALILGHRSTKYETRVLGTFFFFKKSNFISDSLYNEFSVLK